MKAWLKRLCCKLGLHIVPYKEYGKFVCCNCGTAGEKALKEVAQMVLSSQQRRERLREAGWERVLNPPLVGNQWIWRHSRWFVQLEEEAVRILDIEESQGVN